MNECEVQACTKMRMYVTAGMCESHYRRNLKYGNPLGSAPRKTVEERFWEKVEKSESGCWNWTGALSWNGYGMFRESPDPKVSSARAYRYSYTLANGPIREGMQIDHKCFTKKCVNPDHLREVTVKQNSENRPGPQSTSKTGVQGVHWLTAARKYRGGVRHNGRMHWVGLFDSLAEAEAAVIAKRNELFTHNDRDRAA